MSPKEIANAYLNIGKNKCALPALTTIILGFMGGMFIAFAAVASATASSTISSASAARLLSAAVFPPGLIMVLIAGSELFTGNNLLVMPLLKKVITLRAMLRNWALVYVGNLLGSLFIVGICAMGGQWKLYGGGLAITTINTALTKVGYSFPRAFALGIACNILVCIAVWMSFAAKDTVSRVAAIYFPVFLFVLCGFEHSIANMYYIPAGIIAAADPAFAAEALARGIDTTALTWGNFLLRNLLPVTLGNIVGGSVVVGGVYTYCYLKD